MLGAKMHKIKMQHIMFVIALMFIYNYMFAGADTSHEAMERRSPLYPPPKLNCSPLRLKFQG